MRMLLLSLLLVGCTRIAEPPPKVAAGQIFTNQSIRLVLVNEGAFLIKARADQEHDGQTSTWVYSTYPNFPIEAGTRLKVIQVVQDRAQIEVVDGPQQNRRGWLEVSWLAP